MDFPPGSGFFPENGRHGVLAMGSVPRHTGDFRWRGETRRSLDVSTRSQGVKKTFSVGDCFNGPGVRPLDDEFPHMIIDL